MRKQSESLYHCFRQSNITYRIILQTLYQIQHKGSFYLETENKKKTNQVKSYMILCEVVPSSNMNLVDQLKIQISETEQMKLNERVKQ